MFSEPRFVIFSYAGNECHMGFFFYCSFRGFTEYFFFFFGRKGDSFGTFKSRFLLDLLLFSRVDEVLISRCIRKVGKLTCFVLVLCFLYHTSSFLCGASMKECC